MNQKLAWDKIALSYMSGEILDFGCGEGRFVSHRPQTIIGIDQSPESIRICKEKGLGVFRMSVTDTSFSDNSFDAVHCSHVIEHLMPEDAHKLLSEMDRVLRVGGIFCIRAPLFWKCFYHDLTHVKPYYPEAILHYLLDGQQKTLGEIKGKYEVVKLKYRWSKFRLHRTGFMLILRKL